jgi:hypothetical protein
MILPLALAFSIYNKQNINNLSSHQKRLKSREAGVNYGFSYTAEIMEGNVFSVFLVYFF